MGAFERVRVLQIHNRYREPGGEDVSVDHERRLLEDAGHEVIVYQRDSREIDRFSSRQKLALAWQVSSSPLACREIAARIDRHRPDLAHVHNTVPLLSPAIYAVCRSRGVPVVQTLRNYRFFCASGNFYRAGRVCLDCFRGTPLPAVRHGCYRGSRAQSAALAAMLLRHRRTYLREIDGFVALSQHVKARFLEAGFPADRFFVKPNFEPDPGPPVRDAKASHVLYMGRLTPEKGLITLLRAWRGVRTPLLVAGDGPLRGTLESMCRAPELAHVELRGFLSRDELAHAIAHCFFVVVPSDWHEPFGRCVVEAYAAGRPVVASRIGGLEELVVDGESGALFRAGDDAELRRVARELLDAPEALRRMGVRARSLYEHAYSPAANLRMLLDIYAQVLRSARA